MSTRAPRNPYPTPRPGSVANNKDSRKSNSMANYNTSATFRNSRKQLTPAQMDKLSKLIKTTDTLYHKVATIVKEKTCRKKPEELNLKLYSEILKDPKQTEEAKHDVMIQLIALKQIFKGERVVDKNTVSLFNDNHRALTVIGIVIACVGFVMPLGAFGDLIEHASPEFMANAEETAVREYEMLNPSLTEDEIRSRYSSQIRKIGMQAQLISGAQERPISAALSAMGTGIIGFIPSLVAGFVTAFVAPIPVTLILAGSKDAIKKVTLQQTIKEIEKIINDPENPPGLAESVEEELKVTAIEAPPQEELEHIVAPEAAAPLQRMSNFTSYTPAPGTPARRVAPPAAPPLQRMNNFMSYRPVPGEAWPEKHTKIRISNTPNVINENEMVAKENHAAISESRKGFPVSSSLFSTAKGRQAQVNRENARLNAEWNATHSRPKGPSEATRSARNKKSILKKGGKTRKQRK